MSNPTEKSYVEETIKLIRPSNSNRVWNESEYDVIQTSDADGGKLVILRAKVNDNIVPTDPKQPLVAIENGNPYTTKVES